MTQGDERVARCLRRVDGTPIASSARGQDVMPGLLNARRAIALACLAACLGLAACDVGNAAKSRQERLALAGLSTTAIDTTGVRPDVLSFLEGLGVSGAPQTILYGAARAMQATLTVDLTRRADLQLVVDKLAQASACMHVHFQDAASQWTLLEALTYNTFLRRVRHGLFVITSRLLVLWPDGPTCPTAPPPPPPTPPPPPPPSAGQLLRQEFARLEQQGVLPVLDRSTDLRGPDVNDNGVRDDIEAYIASLPINDAQRRAAMQTARVQQKSLLIDLSDRQAVVALGEASMAATACMGLVFEDDIVDRTRDLSLKIEAITANTPERAKRYIKYMAALSGTSTAYPEHDTCEP